MEIDDVLEWTLRGFLGAAFVMAVVVVILLLIAVITEVAYQIRQRRNNRRATPTTPVPAHSPSSSLVEKLLATIPDVAYLPLGGGGDGGDSDRESCVICVTPYEAGEACSVMPSCKHLFHKACVAKWLRVWCTCPLCRAAVFAPPLPHRPVPQGYLNEAENMV